MWPATNVLKMGRERTTRHPRQLAGVSGYNLEVKVVDELTRPPTETRVYDDGEGKIEAVIVASLPVDEINPIVAEYLYDGKPVPELWPTEGQDQYSPRIAEMVTACKAFGRLGCKGVAMVSRDPPYPDLFVQSPLTGEIAVEITLGRDEEEAAFQSRRAALQKLLNDIARDQGLVLPYDVNISVVELPRAKEMPPLAEALLNEICVNANTVGTYPLSGDVAAYATQYQVILHGRAVRPPLECAALANVRGHEDLCAIVAEAIAYKRRYMRYSTDSRPLWLVVGVIVRLFMGNVMSNLYRTDVKLGVFERIVLSDESSTVIFRRADRLE